ncbi:xanthine dehydrogenase family protein subunit M [Pigmentiphaga soli]|uniref:Xanthine dehydrogenase family protein subunit M n=1 Tax=Pigmentiphaga soli TaxID=1007095 RepID=A0ABP8HI57_9BURK
MKPSRFSYASPATLDAALALLAGHGEMARPLAGGQSLIPAMNFRLAAPEVLVDLGNIPALRGIALRPDGGLEAGAMARHADFEHSAAVARSHPLIPAVMAHVAHAQVRYRGTLGGSLAHADPAAEWAAVCVALDAVVTVAGANGPRDVPAADFTQGVYTTALQPGEILARVAFPPWPAGRRWGFCEIARRTGDFALAGAIALLDGTADGICHAARIVVFGVADTPVVLRALGERLLGRRVDAEACDEIGFFARSAIEPRSDLHASADYRVDLIEAVVARALRRAIQPDPQEWT